MKIKIDKKHKFQNGQIVSIVKFVFFERSEDIKVKKIRENRSIEVMKLFKQKKKIKKVLLKTKRGLAPSTVRRKKKEGTNVRVYDVKSNFTYPDFDFTNENLMDWAADHVFYNSLELEENYEEEYEEGLFEVRSIELIFYYV